MSLISLKLINAVLLLIAALTAALSMLALMGKVEKKSDPLTLRRIHRRAGILFGLFLIAQGIMGFLLWEKAGDQAPLRAVIHVYLSLSLIAVFIIKMGVVKIYRQFLRIAPALGLSVFALMLVIFLSSAGYFFLRSFQETPPPATDSLAGTPQEGDVLRGESLFQARCAGCHFADREDQKIGPGLKGLFKKTALPVSGRPASPENVIHQLKAPFLSMPAFPSIADQDLSHLLAYLKSL